MKNKMFLRNVLNIFFFFTILGIVTVLPSIRGEETVSERPVPDLLTSRDRLQTVYQQAGGYQPTFDLKTDAVMVYGVSDADIDGYPLWREKSGSVIQAMTGVAWGNYQDYLNGEFDGLDHWDDAQMDAAGNPVLHAQDKNIPYLSPSMAFSNYLSQRLKKVVDAGITEIYLEEPEFWAFSGYGDSFKREWLNYYNEPWTRPDSSPDAQWKASRLKAYLYRRTLDHLAAQLKEYSLKKYGRHLSFYVATHSLLCYAQIRMVSPEAALVDLPTVDGIIAQIWTGTARFPNIYNGVLRERTFEAAYLEYNLMAEMVRGTGKRVYFLNDPVEDDPNHDWNDYRKNYFQTLTASLMQAGNPSYEVAPWPSRVFLQTYPIGSPEAAAIPQDYASLLLVGFNQLRDMDYPDSESSWNGASEGIGVLVSDSMMFQRGAENLWDNDAENTSADLSDLKNARLHPTREETAHLNGLFSLTLPLLKRGVPVRLPLLDHVVRFPGYLDSFDVLVLSYEFQKPLSAGIDSELINWVRRGGVLVYVGAGTDPFHQTQDWWRTGASDYPTADAHLMEGFGLELNPENGEYQFGKGRILVDRTAPDYYGRAGTSGEYIGLIRRALTLKNRELTERNYLLNRRGPYLMAAVLDESISDTPLVLEGNFIDLTDPELTVFHRREVSVGEFAWLLDLDRVRAKAPAPLICGGRIEDWQEETGRLSFTVSGPQGEPLIARFLLKQAPKETYVNGQRIEDWTWDDSSKTFFFHLTFPNAKPIFIEIF